MLPKEEILAEIIHGEVILELHGKHAHQRHRLHVLLVWDGVHGHVWVSGVHAADIRSRCGWEGIDTVKRRRSRGE